MQSSEIEELNLQHELGGENISSSQHTSNAEIHLNSLVEKYKTEMASLEAENKVWPLFSYQLHSKQDEISSYYYIKLKSYLKR